MFYLEGMKEYHEYIRAGGQMHRTQLVTPKLAIHNSLNRYSTTLLIDVAERKLVQHTAEIDYLDPDRPMVLVFPGQPLKHTSHYALAVVNATGPSGEPLSQSPGLKKLLSCGGSNCPDGRRLERFRHRVLPALEQAAPWVSLQDDPEGLQVLFDFPTISAQSQLGNIRAVRDKTFEIVQGWNWHEHVRVNQQVDYTCNAADENVIARTIHAEMDVPWFLEQTGQRGAAIHNAAVHGHNKHVPTGVAKFVLHIPCSVRERICENGDSPDIPAILEYGHGLFYNRQEASFDYVMNMADSERYIVAAMDWRGMSSYDLLVVVKTLIAEPSLARAIRDNLIQGYGNKLALQHFLRSALWETSWFHFKATDTSSCTLTGKPSKPIHAFYGNSQGGILGAGYSALLGKTGLLDRVVLGVPGTPFAKIMTRSLDFSGKINQETNRWSRLFFF